MGVADPAARPMIPFDLDDADQHKSPEAQAAGAAPSRSRSSRRGSFDAGIPDVMYGADVDDVAAGLPPTVRQYLGELSKDELIVLVERLAAQNPSVQQALVARVRSVPGPDADLLRIARATIDSISAGAITSGNAPDADELDQLRDDLDALIDRGRADDVLILCERLLRRADRAVEVMYEADDDFFGAIHRVLSVVSKALVRSSKPPVQQMLWLVELELSQAYELLPSMAAFWSQEWSPEVWSGLADGIEARLDPDGPGTPMAGSSPSTDYRRDTWASRLVDALGRAGRHDEIVPLLEREAEITVSYPRLVTHVLDAGDFERAEHWARRGIEVAVGPWPGIASSLRESLRAIRERQGDLGGVAAHRAYDFFYQPGLKTFQELLASAEAAGLREPVRRHALRFLETLGLPWSSAPTDEMSDALSRNAADTPSSSPAEDAASDSTALPPWPLPPTGLPDPVPYRREQPPLARVLLEIALAERRLDDVLAWFDWICQRKQYGLLYGDLTSAVARAVEASHPERAIAIWDDLAAEAISRTSTEAYLEAARYLDRSGRIEERRGNLAAWRARIRDLQAQERRKWRLRQILDDLLNRFPSA